MWNTASLSGERFEATVGGWLGGVSARASSSALCNAVEGRGV